MMFATILEFWFEELEPKQWWAVNPGLDDEIRARFLPTLNRARQGELFEWRSSPKGRLAEIIVLDQFSRNIHRGTAMAFSQDPMALVLAQEAVAHAAHLQLSPVECAFLLIPYMHSESRFVHAQAEPLYKTFAPAVNHDFELKHKVIVDRFGRYPHRNAILGRESTPEEIEFLKQPGSSF